MCETEFTESREGPSLEQFLPEPSVLDLENYLAMQNALGDETRFRILYALKCLGNADLSDLESVLDVDANRVKSGLDELVNVGLAENRIRNEPEENGVYSHYRASAVGKALLEEGIEELIRTEWDARERYS